MGQTDRILVERHGPTVSLTLDNPARRNAVSYEMWQRLAAVLGELEGDDAVRVLVLTGAGDRAFSAGADISEFEQWRSSEDRTAEYDRAAHAACAALGGFSRPTVARIHGYCVGGGFELALLCDIRVCAEDARFAVTPAKLGIGYDLTDTELLVDRLGAPAAREILFTGRMFSAEEALRLGVVNRVVPAAALDEAVAAYTDEIAGNAPLTLIAAKRIIAEAAKPPADRDAALCDRLVRDCYASADYVEGRRAFAEKRRPRFTGR